MSKGRVRLLSVSLWLAAWSLSTFAQSDRGTITGTVADPGGAVVPSAGVVIKSVETGAEYQTSSTGTGNYTVSSLPAGAYQLTVTMAGFKSFRQDGITVQVAQTARIDVVLQVGVATETVTVHADAALLQTESSEQSTTVDKERLLALPIYFGSGQGGGAIRNPLTFATLVPGAVYQQQSNEQIRVNGFPNQSFKIILEGQDATSPLVQQAANVTVPSMEAVQEFTLQSSGFSAEFGQVLGGMFNPTTRSGTNEFHGSGYEYLTNEDLNAGVPFTSSGVGGHHLRPRVRKNDYGASVGGPVRIPKLYSGKDRSFFFFNFERYNDQKTSTPALTTIPTLQMRSGDFSGILDNRVLGTDVLGRSILENVIYDPATRTTTTNGQIVTNPFPGNVIPTNRIDPVAAKIQAMIPQPTNSSNLNNWLQVYPNPKTQYIVSVKLDQNIGEKTKISEYFGHQTTNQLSAPDGLPIPLSEIRSQVIFSNTFRLNFDRIITPTLLFHAGIGDQHYYNPDSSPDSVLHYDAVGKLGFNGGAVNGMPKLTGLSNAFGGMSFAVGTNNANHYRTEKPTAVANMTWVRGNHTYKAGGEFRIDVFGNQNAVNAPGVLNFNSDYTGLPYLQTTSIGGGLIGNPYASFLLGGANNATVSNVQDPQWRKRSYGAFIQDTWKVTSKLTLDYGLRWDREGMGHELYYRESNFDPTKPNPSAGGLLGATTYEGYGSGRCNCVFAQTYPYGFGNAAVIITCRRPQDVPSHAERRRNRSRTCFRIRNRPRIKFQERPARVERSILNDRPY
jgi:hypothetical protein